MKGTSNHLLVAVATVAASLGNSGFVLVDAFNSFFATPLKSPLSPASKATASAPPPPPSQINRDSWLDVLNYNKDGDKPTPSFNVLAKTIEYANCKDFDTIMSYYSDDYVFRGPIIGPITAEDVRKTQEVSPLVSTFPMHVCCRVSLCFHEHSHAC